MNDFRGNFLSGVFYTSVSKYMGIFLQIIISAVLARLLEPEDFGIVAIATVVIGFINLLTDFGLAPAVVQNDDLDANDIKSLFNMTIYIGLFASILLFLFSDFLSSLYNDIRLQPIIKLLSLNVFFAAINIIPNSLLLKNKKFKLIAVRTLSIQVISGVLAILAAISGWGVYSLVVNSIFTSFGIFIFNYWQHRIPIYFRFQIMSLKKILKFSIVQFISQIITYVNGTLDKLLVGKFLGLLELGYYEKSYRLMRMPVTNLTYVFTPVMQPLFKDLKENLDEMECKYSKLFKCIVIIGFPLSCFLYFSASDLIYLFFGEKWTLAIRPFQLFSISVGFSMLLSSTGPIYQVTNSLKSQIASSIGETILSIICLFYGLKLGGVNNVALWVSIGIFLRFIYSMILIYHFIFKMRLLKIFKYMLHGIICCLIFSAFALYTHYIFGENFSLVHLSLNTIFLFVIIFVMLYIKRFIDLKFLGKLKIKR